MKSLHPIWPHMTPKIHSIVFVFLIGVLLLANFFVSGAVFEGYLISESFKNLGFQASSWGFLGRPLSATPHTVIWYFFEGSHFGYFIVSSFLMLFRGATIFLLAKELKNNVWFLSLAAMLVPLWGAIFNERFIGAQLSLNFGILAICLYIKNHQKLSVFVMLLATFAYPPIVLAAPIAILIFKGQAPSAKSSILPSLFSKAALLIPLAIYVAWLSIIRFFGNESYDTAVSGIPPMRMALQNLFETLVVENTIKTLLISILPVVLAKTLLPSLNLFIILGTTFFIFISPLPYARVAIHLNDPERVFFPISSTVLFIFILHLSSVRPNTENKSLGKNSLFAYLLSGAFFLGLSLCYWIPVQHNNRQFLAELNKQINLTQDATSLLVRDNTGYLGDVNTFYGDAKLEDILTGGNSLLAAIRIDRPSFESSLICTPSSVERRHPVAANFPIPTTRRCEDIAESADINLQLSSLNPVRLEPYSPE